MHPEFGRPVEVPAGARAEMLEAPAVIGTDQLVSRQGGFVGIQGEVDCQVAIGMQRHLPAGRRSLIQDRVKFSSAVVHRLQPTGFRRINTRHLRGLGAQVRK